jgi:hypothetical protein
MITIVLQDGTFQKDLSALVGRVGRPRAVLMPAGREARNVLLRHYRELDRKRPNALGGERTHFWAAVGRSVHQPQMESGDQAVTVSVSHPVIRQKVFGGPIVAKRVKYLTIPVTSEAYGKYAATFERETGLKLFFIKTSVGPALATKRDPKSRFFQIEYVLRHDVNQKPDPDALPQPGVMETAVLKRAETVVQRLIAGQSGPAA